MPKFISGFIGGALTVALVGSGIAAANGNFATTVVRVIDGDTLVARINGDETTIRLLNVDTPETKDPTKPTECMGPEASKFLESRLPPGTSIRLEYDKERVDRYGRTLAGLYESGSLVNAEIAAKGLGVAVLFEPNSRFYAEVKQAEAEAQASHEGLFDPAPICTIPARWERAIGQTASDPTATYVTSATVLIALDQLESRLASARTWMSAMMTKATFSPVEAVIHRAVDASYLSRLLPGLTNADSTIAALQIEHDRLVKSEEQAATAERKRVAVAKAAAKKKAAAKADAKRRAAEREAAQRAAAQRASQKPSAKPPRSRYTGPRCYAPGGKTWRPC